MKFVEHKISFRMVFSLIYFALMVLELFTFKFDKILIIQILPITFKLPKLLNDLKTKTNSRVKILEHKILF